MSNKIAVIYDSVSFVMSNMKMGTLQKTEVHNESKNVYGQSMIFRVTNPTLADSLPDSRKNAFFIISR